MAEIIKLYEENTDQKQLRKIAKAMKEGALVIYPTDTVYGLGCDITNKAAVERIAQIKGVKSDKANFSFICESLSNLSDYTSQIDSGTFKLLKRNLPGPYTFILSGNNNLPGIFKKKKTVGIRVPDNAIALGLVRELGNPIISTSIKDDDEVLEYTTDPSLIAEKWDKLVDIVIDAGFGGNVGSTVIDLTTAEPTVIREGKGSIEL
jgi:tRNA threonylcarbamoyl adenosine modification protein (Sua5/YciO/YrdC/YwlC family)